MIKYRFVIKQLLKTEYIINKKSMSQIAKEIGCSKRTVANWLIKYKIKSRTRKEAVKRGIDNHLYTTGSTSIIRYCKLCGSKICYKTWKRGTGKCRSCSKMGKIHNIERHKKHHCKKCNKEIGYDCWKSGSSLCKICINLGKHLSEKHKQKIRIGSLKNWKKKEYREKVIRNTLKASHVKVNKQEKTLNELLQKILPKEYKINIKGEIMILGRKIPDFVNVNGQKKVIEMYGDYWHSDKFIKKHGCYEDTEKGRIKYFKKLGWKTLIIWEHELKNLEKVEQRILKFNKTK